MCGDRKASSPRVMQIVFFSQAPVASTEGPARGSRIGRGVWPRARRMNCGAPIVPWRSTLSSQRATMSRSCSSSASAMPESRASASSLPITRGSPPGLALVITSSSSCGACRHALPAGLPAASWNSRVWIGVQGSITPSRSRPGATPAICSAAPCCIGSSTIGRAADSSSACSGATACTQRAAEARLATITANGFSSRCLRSRRRATADALRASQARWKPPRPLMATMRPSRSSASVPAMASPAIARPCASTKASAGPQAGQALGSAWKRRSSGSRYSRRHSAHCAKPAMLVCARS